MSRVSGSVKTFSSRLPALIRQMMPSPALMVSPAISMSAAATRLDANSVTTV
nr:hypothetical protein [Kutzneria chonburiensis]